MTDAEFIAEAVRRSSEPTEASRRFYAEMIAALTALCRPTEAAREYARRALKRIG